LAELSHFSVLFRIAVGTNDRALLIF
jgi:hypothetical protein